MNGNETVLTITWTVEDFVNAMIEEGIAPTEDNLKKLLRERNIKTLEEASIERGWETIDAMINADLKAKSAGDKKRLHVVAAIIESGNNTCTPKVFATQRGYGQYKDWWEFPGGKVEQGETPEEALIREIREELAAEIIIKEYLTTVEYEYPEFHLSMECFLCELNGDHISLLEHEAAKWLSLSEIDTVNWLPADIEVVNLLKTR